MLRRVMDMVLLVIFQSKIDNKQQHLVLVWGAGQTVGCLSLAETEGHRLGGRRGKAEIAGLDNEGLDIDGLDNDGLDNDGRICGQITELELLNSLSLFKKIFTPFLFLKHTRCLFLFFSSISFHSALS